MILRTQRWGWGWLVLKPSKTCPFREALAIFITSSIWEKRKSLTHHNSQNELCLQWNGYGVQPLLSHFVCLFSGIFCCSFWPRSIAWGILAPGPGTEPGPWQWKWRILTIVVAVQPLIHVWLFVIPWTAAHQASLCFTISWSLFKLISIELVMPSNHLILCQICNYNVNWLVKRLERMQIWSLLWTLQQNCVSVSQKGLKSKTAILSAYGKGQTFPQILKTNIKMCSLILK